MVTNQRLMAAKRHARIRRHGQTLVEYALIIAVIAIVAVAVLSALGHQTQALYTSINFQVARSGGS
jgi:Flp pilus assembly pilin Flp